MEAYAVVQTGGKQYLAQARTILKVEKLSVQPGEKIELQPVLALSDGTALKVGKPAVEGAKVTATVVEHIRGPKIISYKKKRRKGYERKKGHRQALTVLRVEAVA
jgi:large subunit ribosomal protein L21